MQDKKTRRVYLFYFPVSVHYGLEDGGEGRDPDAGPDQHRVLRSIDVGGRRPERTVNIDLERLLQPGLVTDLLESFAEVIVHHNLECSVARLSGGVELSTLPVDQNLRCRPSCLKRETPRSRT